MKKRSLKVGDWYIIPRFLHESHILFYRIGMIEKKYNAYTCYDRYINEKGNLSIRTFTHSKNSYSAVVMYWVPKRIINIILNKKPGYENLIEIYKTLKNNIDNE